MFVAVRVCEAGLEDAKRATISQHFESVHPAENFASLEDIPKEKLRDRNQNPGKDVVISNNVNEASTDEDEKLEANPAKRLKVELSSPEDAGKRFTGALIPLPFIEFPRHAKFYSCTVCSRADSSFTFSSLGQFEKHRESDKHRSSYGEKFRGNNCRHFPDGAHGYNAQDDLTCCYCSAKVRDGCAG